MSAAYNKPHRLSEPTVRHTEDDTQRRAASRGARSKRTNVIPPPERRSKPRREVARSSRLQRRQAEVRN